MKWEKLIKEFKNYLIIERNLSKNTIDSYLFDLKKLKLFLDSKNLNINPLKINESLAKEFIYQISKKVKSSTQARIISGIKRFYDYIMLEELINENPFQNIETPKIGTTLPVTLTTNEIDKIINSIDEKSKNKLRNIALLEVLYSCGLRVSELITLKISDLFFKESLIKVTGKGNKERFVQVGYSKALEIATGGERVMGEECFKLGLTNKLVESNEIIDVAKSWAIELSKKPTIGIGITKQDMIFSLNNDLLSTIEFEAKEQVAAFYSEDLKEGVTAFLEKRKANFKGK